MVKHRHLICRRSDADRAGRPATLVESLLHYAEHGGTPPASLLRDAAAVIVDRRPVSNSRYLTAAQVIDATCDCERCVSRTTATYDMMGRCVNCGAEFVVRNRKGDKTPLSVECPACGVTVFGWSAR